MHDPAPGARKPGLAALALSALGVVFGDIGTSPLYSFKEAFAGEHGLTPVLADVLPALSAIFWAVLLVVSIKYILIVLRFDNEGEGGVLALTALANRVSHHADPRWGMALIAIGVFAAALFYGDAVITPAISVLSAVEGIAVAAPGLEHAVIPVTVGILIALFAIQKHGTTRVGVFFGPITVLWFLTIGTLGVLSIVQTPEVLQAVNPMHALDFAVQRPGAAFLLLGAVFLALTGGEALYADMGHFGARPIRVAWFVLVFPALLLNYFGQGALVLREPGAIGNPFYKLAPDWFALPLVVIATAATVIASQATISGAFSMTLQASRLGFLPRVRILHTSETERGQIYIPSVNWLMLVAVLMLVLEFRSSGALAAAYGIAVSCTEIITTTLTAFVVLQTPNRRFRTLLLVVLGLFFLLESLFLSSNLTKITHGGWLPLVLGAFIFTLLTTWKKGSGLVAAQRRKLDIPMDDFLTGPAPDVTRVPGTAVYLTSDPTIVPSALFHNLKHFFVMHERTVFLHVINAEVPRVAEDKRLTVVDRGNGVYQVDMRFGFREEANVPLALEGAARLGLEFEPLATTFFVARATIVDGPGELSRWRCAIFSWMTRQAEGAATYYSLPPNRVVELGTQVIL